MPAAARAPRYAVRMQMMLDALWRALADCLRVRVMAWSLFPLLLLAVMAALFGVFWWDASVGTVQSWLERASWLQWLWSWMGTATAAASAVAAAVTVVLLVSPVMIMIALAVVSVVMTPQMVELVAARRFAHLQRKHGAGWVGSAWWALCATALALLALLLSLPLWLVPPFVLVLPPLIGGWLTYRLMTFDALAEHASKSERQAIFVRHRMALLWIGLCSGYLGAAPAVVWASGVVFAAAFMVLIPLGIWIYTLVFAFSSLWFAHFCLAALQALRAENAALNPPSLTPSSSSEGLPP